MCQKWDAFHSTCFTLLVSGACRITLPYGGEKVETMVAEGFSSRVLYDATKEVRGAYQRWGAVCWFSYKKTVPCTDSFAAEASELNEVLQGRGLVTGHRLGH